MIKGNLKSKKGNAIIDTVLIIGFLVTFGIAIFFGAKVMNQVNSQIQNDASWTDTTSKQAVNSLTNKFPNTFDNMFVMAFILLWAVTLVASFMIDTHPIFFVFSLLLFIAVLFVAPIVGNSVETLMIDGEIAGTVALFPKINWILTHMLQVAIVVGASIMLVLYGKNN